jgi:hypothetical protein
LNVGDIYKHENFYSNRETGQLLPKFLLILALPVGGDVVARLLTSQHEGVRSEQPPCHHGDPYPGFYLGVIGSPLVKKSWLDLRPFEDLDVDDFRSKLGKDVIRFISALTAVHLRPALECAAGADDTTRQQEQSIRDAIAGLS